MAQQYGVAGDYNGPIFLTIAVNAESFLPTGTCRLPTALRDIRWLRRIARPRPGDHLARLGHRDIPDRLHVGVGALVAPAVVAVAQLRAHLGRAKLAQPLEVGHRL